MRGLDVLGELVFPLRKCVACGGGGDLVRGACIPCLSCLPGLALPQEEIRDDLNGHAYARAFAPYAYRGCVRRMIGAMKFRGEARPALAHLAPAMAALAQRCAPKDAVVTPVPLSKARLRERGYNQAALLAGHIAKALRLPLDEGILWRTRSTKRQMDLSRAAREQNVTGAFQAGKGQRGKAILLIDDVITSGATASACAQALLAAGAREVVVLAAAHALIGEDTFVS